MNLRRSLALGLLCLASLAAPMAQAASPNVVISQVYGGGGATTGSPAYINDYVELFNTSGSNVVIGGWSLQYGSSTGNFASSASTLYVFPAGTTIPGGRYLLVKLGGAGTVGASFAADLTSGNLSMAAGSGKVALVNTNTSLGCGATANPCALPHASIVDSVSYGATNNAEGGATVNNGTGLQNTQGAIRKNNGCQDTDNNFADFTVATTATGLVPRTLAGGASHSCVVVNHAPSIGAPANPAAVVFQDAAPFTVTLTGSDDFNVYNWSATPGTGIASVNVTSGQGNASATFTVAVQAGFTGIANFTALLSDNVNPATPRSVNIQVNPNVVNAAPSIVAPPTPIATVTENAAPFAVSLSGSDDNNVFHWSATPGSGVSAVAVSSGQGTSSATFTVTLQAAFSGTATFTASLYDNFNAPVTRIVSITVTPLPPPPLDHLVISQIYGGGGNSNATYRNDYVELYNPTLNPVDLAGWTIQYASSTGSSWQTQPLGGVMHPGEYYLISLASGGAIGALLPTANIDGSINMSGTTGKVALVSSGNPLDGTCPLGGVVVDFVGYGTGANCREGSSNAGAPSNTTAIFRKNGGFTDTNANGADFQIGVPSPRRTAPIVELGPAFLFSDPRNNASTAPRDANISVTFTEDVSVAAGWFAINCATTGNHNDATVHGGPSTWIIIPNVNFLAGEQCSVTIFKDFVHDQDLDDSGPSSDTLPANVTFSFTVATGTAPAYSADVHIAFGNPSGAVADVQTPNNYLMLKPELALSYNRDRGTPNWVSWHLDDTWVGTLTRVDTFRADPAVPADWYRVLGSDYSSSGFDRGHMVPNADRDKETSIPINQATFLMTNMIPQAPDNNQGPWAEMENYLRTLLPANELYIVAGGAGTGGSGSNGFASTIANGHVTVPANTWKVVLVIPKDSGDDVARVGAGARTIAVLMPNAQGIRNTPWQNFLTTVDAVESLTGYDFFANVSDLIENAIEAGINGANPPGVANQSLSTSEDTARTFTLESASASSNLTYTIVAAPQHGTLSGSGASQTYTPAPDFNGTDTFTFKVSDGSLSSGTAKVTITVLEVNDVPAAANDARSTNEDTALQFNAAELASNDVAGPANESGQTLTVTSVAATANTNGTVALSNGIVTYTPAPNYNGPASFAYTVCDNGVTSGVTTSQCATATVNVNVAAVNDAPTATLSVAPTGIEGTAITATATAGDIDGDSLALQFTVNGVVSGSGSSITFTPADNGPYVVAVVVTDGAATAGDAKSVNVANAAPAVVSVTGPTASLSLGSAATIAVGYTDPGSADTHSAVVTWDDGTSSTVACAAGTCTATRTYTAAGIYDVAIVLSDDDGASVASSFQSVIVTDANAGSVTGGGWISTDAGKANFSLTAQYKKGASTPTGSAQFDLAGAQFKATTFEWLVVSRPNAHVEGSGTINGAGSYGFRITAVDGETDKFRIRVWDKANGNTVYDTTDPQPLGGGSITIHK